MELLFKGVSRRTSLVIVLLAFKISTSILKMLIKLSMNLKKTNVTVLYHRFLFGSGNDRTLTIPTTIDIDYFFDNGQGGTKK